MRELSSMQATFIFPIIIAFIVIGSRALEENDTGVCSKTETTVVSRTETFMSSYAAMFQTCTIWVFCSTKYRLAYRSRSRTVFRTVENEFLTCCSGYVHVDDECKSKATAEATSTSPPLTSNTSSSAVKSFSTSFLSMSKEQSTEAITTTLSNIPVENKSLPLVTTMMVSGVVGIVIVVGVLALFLILFVFKRRKRSRLQHASSPLQRVQQEEERRNGQELPVQYYAVIPDNKTDTSGVVIGASSPNPSLSKGFKQATKKKTLTHKPLSLKTISKGEANGIAADQDERNASHRLLSEDSSYYTEMDDHKETNIGTVGYIDMRSPTADITRDVNCTYMGQESERYTEMNTKIEADDEPQSSQDGAYGKLNLGKSSSIDNNCYDTLDRSNDLLWRTAQTNNYDKLGRTSEEDSNDHQEERNAHVNHEDPFEYTQSECLHDRGRKYDNATYSHVSSGQVSEPTYYNNPGEQAQLPEDSNDVPIYTNVSVK